MLVSFPSASRSDSAAPLKASRRRVSPERAPPVPSLTPLAALARAARTFSRDPAPASREDASESSCGLRVLS